jgi:hypothetical protein
VTEFRPEKPSPFSGVTGSGMGTTDVDLNDGTWSKSEHGAITLAK